MIYLPNDNKHLGVFPTTTKVTWDGVDWDMVSESDLGRAWDMSAWGATKRIDATANFPQPRLSIRVKRTTRYYDPQEVKAFMAANGW